jgi:hypothetical protein
MKIIFHADICCDSFFNIDLLSEIQGVGEHAWLALPYQCP